MQNTCLVEWRELWVEQNLIFSVIHRILSIEYNIKNLFISLANQIACRLVLECSVVHMAT